jgi:hypothetical protein
MLLGYGDFGKSFDLHLLDFWCLLPNAITGAALYKSSHTALYMHAYCTQYQTEMKFESD